MVLYLVTAISHADPIKETSEAIHINSLLARRKKNEDRRRSRTASKHTGAEIYPERLGNLYDSLTLISSFHFDPAYMYD